MGGILVLQGSPRPDGNTARLARALADGAGGQAEIFSVCAHTIRPCLGCNACAAAPGHVCVQRDDMRLLYDKLRQTRTLVIASPVYFYGVSAQLKAAVDRLHTPLRGMRNGTPLPLFLIPRLARCLPPGTV